MGDNVRLANQLANRGSSKSAAWAKELAGTPDLLSSLSSLVISKPVDTATKGVATTTSTGASANKSIGNGGSSQGGTPSGVGQGSKADASKIGKMAQLAQLAGVLTGQPELAFLGKAVGTGAKIGSQLLDNNPIKAGATALGFMNPTIATVNTGLGLAAGAGRKLMDDPDKGDFNPDLLDYVASKLNPEKSIALDYYPGMSLKNGQINFDSVVAGKLSPEEAMANWKAYQAGDIDLSGYTKAQLGPTDLGNILSSAVKSDILGVEPYQTAVDRALNSGGGRSDGYSGSTPSGASPSWGNAQNERTGSTGNVGTQSDTGNTSEGRTDNSDGKSSDMGGVA